jgi:multiple sugar transport system substrate-binding protein
MHRRTPVLRATALASTLLLAAACGNGFSEAGGGEGDGPTSAEGTAKLRMLIASSGDAETKTVNEAVDAWEKETGNRVTVTLAQDMTTELSKTFASNDPYDLMYIDAGRFATYADTGALYPYGDEVEAADGVYESLRDTFTYDDELYCLPKDFSTLGLVINTRMWKEAGLTDQDVPQDWDELAAVARNLTTDDHVGLSFAASRDRVNAFMVGAGGWPVNEDGTEATADSPENVEALTFLQQMLSDGSLAWSSELDTGWGGEAFGTEKAAMTVEGNWIRGAMAADYPDVDYQVAELPEGPAGPGSLLFTQCWGVSAKSDAQAQAIDLIESLTSPEQQMRNAETVGVMPALEASGEEYVEKYPEDAAFVAAGDYARGPISLPDFEPVLADFDSQLAGLEKGDPEAILRSLQDNASAALGG